MRLAISNIAWAPAQDEEVAAALRAAGAFGVEVAPTAIWPDPLRVPAAERRAYRARWERLGYPIAALQSLVFGRPELQLFDPGTRPALAAHLEGMLEVARDLGASRLVFGSPRNRTRGALPVESALEIAVPFFQAVGRAAAALGVVLCVEPNPPAYGCDFVTTSGEGLALVDAVGSPGFGLHLDAAGMHLAGEVAAEAVARCARAVRHVHLSAPQLAPVTADPAACRALVGPLRAAGYDGVVSIEMRAGADAAASLANVRAALAFGAELLRAR